MDAGTGLSATHLWTCVSFYALSLHLHQVGNGDHQIVSKGPSSMHLRERNVLRLEVQDNLGVRDCFEPLDQAKTWAIRA